MTDALMQSVHAIPDVNLEEYINSQRSMLPWMVAYDNKNYARWLPDFWAMLQSLPPD